ncbi:MAG: hypothetical protein J6R47_00725 [Acholeplasmatales bacterium]|nr:hypothetical protein [Acholeplasmatales bacterium]
MVLVEKFEKHDTLNPKLWKNNKLLPEVKDKIIEIIKEFLSTIDLNIKIIDARIVGSQASFNYTEYSDLDIHLITNFELMDASEEILTVLYNALKTKFNKDYNVTIKGINVELYIEDMKSSAISNGVYSIFYSQWIKFPKKLDSIPEIDTSNEFRDWKDKIDKVIQFGNPESIEKTIDDLYILRKDSLDIDGEYGKGNQIFKDIRNAGLLDDLKTAYKKKRSKELTLESLRLNEDSRAKLLAKSKSSKKGFERFKKRVKSRVANSVKQYNAIDMNKLFKDNILTVDVNVKGETDTYTVKMSFGGFLGLLRDQIDRLGKFDLKAVTRALINGFNKDDVYIHCSCPDWSYRYAYFATKNKINSGDPETRASNITNPNDDLGSACKHVLLVLSNNSWLLKVASTIYNYVNYMEKHYNKLYADIIYPTIYGKKYEEPVQLDIFDNDDLATDTDTIDQSNTEARTKNQFQKGNTQGIRFAPKAAKEDQVALFDDEEVIDDNVSSDEQ